MRWCCFSVLLIGIGIQAVGSSSAGAPSSLVASQSSVVARQSSAVARQPPADGSWLEAPLEEGQAMLWHLFHSGFAVRTANHLLIFDYWPANKTKEKKPGLAHGRIDPEELADQNVVVFISHEHHDHWYRKSLEWQRGVKNIHYVVSTEAHQEQPGFDW